MSTSPILDNAAARAWTGRRVLLTGASGFLGGHMARQALAAGVKLSTLGRRSGPPGALHHTVDLRDHDAVAAAVAAVQPEAVLHCAAAGVSPGSMAFAEMLAVAAGGTAALYAACAALAEPPRVVHVGSGFEHDAAPASYGAAKVAAHAVALDFAATLPLAVLRPFHLYGAGETAQRLGPFIVRQALNGAPIPLTGCEQQRDFLHVDDCAAFLWHGLSLTGTFELGTGQPIALRRYVEGIVAALAAEGIDAHCQLGALPYRAGEPMISLPDLTVWNAACPRGAKVSLADGAADLVRSELSRCR